MMNRDQGSQREGAPRDYSKEVNLSPDNKGRAFPKIDEHRDETFSAQPVGRHLVFGLLGTEAKEEGRLMRAAVTLFEDYPNVPVVGLQYARDGREQTCFLTRGVLPLVQEMQGQTCISTREGTSYLPAIADALLAAGISCTSYDQLDRALRVSFYGAISGEVLHRVLQAISECEAGTLAVPDPRRF